MQHRRDDAAEHDAKGPPAIVGSQAHERRPLSLRLEKQRLHHGAFEHPGVREPTVSDRAARRLDRFPRLGAQALFHGRRGPATVDGDVGVANGAEEQAPLRGSEACRLAHPDEARLRAVDATQHTVEDHVAKPRRAASGLHR